MELFFLSQQGKSSSVSSHTRWNGRQCQTFTDYSVAPGARCLHGISFQPISFWTVRQIDLRLLIFFFTVPQGQLENFKKRCMVRVSRRPAKNSMVALLKISDIAQILRWYIWSILFHCQFVYGKMDKLLWCSNGKISFPTGYMSSHIFFIFIFIVLCVFLSVLIYTLHCIEASSPYRQLCCWGVCSATSSCQPKH